MMRIESDSTLSMKYASEHAMFARIEGPDGVWNDAAMPIPPPQQHVEQIVLASALLNSVKDMPFTQDMRVAIDYHMNVMKMTKEARARYPYVFRMIDANTRELLCEKEYLSNPEDGLRGIWEHLPQLVLEGLKLIGKVPGEVITPSGRVFRLVRPLCNEIPFKLTCDAGTDVWK